ncbi:MAG: hypothetical protein J2O44_02190 [Porphyrobacter sp.]|nr:hypothetical protein [Porphyrobacter sp.]
MTLRPVRAASLRLLLALLALVGFAQPAFAKVEVEFHSFNGSVFFGRYPHTFVVFRGTLDETGQKIDENFGFTAKHVSPAVLSGPVEGEIYVEQPQWIARTNRHFTITVDDATYRRMRAEVDFWGHHPGKFYDLDRNNCISFVGKMAEMAGLKVDYPHELMRKPRAWLNRVAALNPQLHAKAING